MQRVTSMWFKILKGNYDEHLESFYGLKRMPVRLLLYPVSPDHLPLLPLHYFKFACHVPPLA